MADQNLLDISFKCLQISSGFGDLSITLQLIVALQCKCETFKIGMFLYSIVLVVSNCSRLRCNDSG